VHELGAEVEAQLGELLRDLRIERFGARGVGQTGFDRGEGGAMYDRLRELLEYEGFEGCFGAEVERPRLRHARDRRRAGPAQSQDIMSASQGGEADLATKESGSAGDDEFHVARLSLGGARGKRGG
jgi:hypothetical protein